MTSKHRFLGKGRGIVYAIHDSRPPSDEDWSVYVEHCRELLLQSADPTKCAGIAITDGGAPNAKQRRQVIALVQDVCGDKIARIRSSVVSDSVLVRGAVTAFSWHIPEIRCFSPAAIHDALEYAFVERAEIPTVIADLEELARPIRTARTVRGVLEQLRRPDRRASVH